MSSAQETSDRPAGRLAVVLAAAALALGCGSAGSAVAPAEGPPRPGDAGAATGVLKGFRLGVRDAIYVDQRTGGRELMVILLSDQRDACAALAEGALSLELFEPQQRRRGSRFLAWTVVGPDAGGRIVEGPVEAAVPAFMGPSPLPPKTAGAYGFPILGMVDAQCRTAFAPVTLGQAAISLHLSEVPDDPDGVVSGEFAVAEGGQRLSGRFKARSCGLPAGFRRPPPPPCRADPGLTSPAASGAAARPSPLGPPIGRAGACWRADLACVLAPGERSRTRRVEVSRLTRLDDRPARTSAFPPPEDGPVVGGPQGEPLYWVATQRAEGGGATGVTAIRHALSGGRPHVVYALDGASFEVPLTARPDGTRRATLRDSDGAAAFACTLTPQRGAGAARWTYDGGGCL